MADNKLEIKYLIIAEDQASKIIQQVEKDVKKYEESIKQTDKATKSFEKQNKSLGDRIKNLTQFVSDSVQTLKNFYDFIVNLDFNKIVRALTILGVLLRFKGMKDASNAVLKFAAQVDIFSGVIDKANAKMKELQGTYGNLTNAFLEVTGIKTFVIELAKLTLGTIAFGAALVGLISSKKVIESIQYGIVLTSQATLRLASGLDLVRDRFPALAAAGEKSLLGISNLLLKSQLTLGQWHLSIHNAISTMKTFANGTFSVSKSLGQAILNTEVFEKGLFGLVTRLTAASAGFIFLGKLLLNTDSTLLKMSGTTLIIFAAAIGGIVYVIRGFILEIGRLIQSIGTGLVNSMQKSVDTMVKLESATFAFEFVVKELDKTTQGATGTFEEWNNVVNDFSKQVGFSRMEVQKSVSEMLRFGNSIGLTKDQMLELLPIIGNVARVNHKDLFTSTLAVVEALAGQTVMLQNMGISLTQHALEESKIGHAINEKIKSMKDSEKVQLRYNVLLEKSALLNGFAEKTAGTLQGQIDRQAASWENISAAMGRGAEIIEQKVNIAWSNLLGILEKMSGGLLDTLGFVVSLSGRILQAVGLALQWSFALIFLTTTIGALNVLLKNQIIAKYLIQLSKAKIITQQLALVNKDIAISLSSFIGNIGRWGLGVRSLGALVLTTFKQFAVLVATASAPIIVLAAKVAIVVGAFYLLYKALKLIDERTKVFTNTWQQIVEWWEDSSLSDQLIARLKEIGKVLEQGVAQAVIMLAQYLVTMFNIWREIGSAIITLVGVFYDLVSVISEVTGITQAFNTLWQIITKTAGDTSAWEKLLQVIKWVGQALSQYIIGQAQLVSIAINYIVNAILQLSIKMIELRAIVRDLARDIGEWLAQAFVNLLSKIANLPEGLLNLIGLNTAWAQSIKEVSSSTSNYITTQRGLTDAEKDQIKNINSRIEAGKNLVSSLGQEQEAQRTLASVKGKSYQKDVEQYLAAIDAKKLIDLGYSEYQKEQQMLADLEKQLRFEENYAFLEANLGREEALKTIARAKELAAAQGHDEKLEDVKKRHLKAIQLMEDAQYKARKRGLSSLFDFEKNTNQGRAANFQSTLGTISSLSQENNKTLFNIGRAAALADATIRGIQAVQIALASAPPPFNFALAALVGVATAANVARIASAKPPQKVYNSGIINSPNKVGDKVNVQANGGEVFLNRADQRNLLDIARFGNAGGNENITELINNLASAVMSQPIVVKIGSREIARAVRDERLRGYPV